MTDRADAETRPATAARMPGLATRIWGMPYLLLMVPPLAWAGNAVIGRAVAGQVPPVGLAFWRWILAFLLIMPLAWPHLRRDLPVLRARWGLVLVLSALGIAVFNTFLYIGLKQTAVVNAVMMQSTMPVLIVLMSFALFAERVGVLQGLGILVSLAGVLAIATRGDPDVLHSLNLNPGDLWVFAAVVCYAGYTALLRKRPATNPFSFVALTFGVGALILLPFYVWESLTVQAMRPDFASLAAVGYVAVFASILAYLCYNRSVELLGPNRTGLSIHLVPVFGSVMAVVFLGESMHGYHAVGIALIALGIAMASRKTR
ncbi:DMT family transporter [Arenibaculum pallidiluteum]|uniref:DMT family transporter n=1 Tax=Arenibaculum pallidiluteum TaxID=2812559 RepID=UPI001F48C135|nr:DMT family transporter [Arenibaculum pallidiluteum]